MVQKKQTEKLLLKTSPTRWMGPAPSHPHFLSMYVELEPYQTASTQGYFAFPAEHE